MIPTPTRPRAAPRPALHVLTPPRRLPRLTRLGWIVAAVLVVAGTGVLSVRASEDETPVERYTPSARGTRPSVTRWQPLLEQYDWNVATGLRVIDCESGGDPEAVNQSSGAAGLMQAMPSWRTLAYRLTGSADLTNPVVNVALAYALWIDSGGSFGWYDDAGQPRGHWGASIHCWSPR